MNLLYGVLLIISGIGMVFYTYKNPNKREFSEGIHEPDFKGYGSGLGLLTIGIIFVVEWFSKF
jgi:hypothetical protein